MKTMTKAAFFAGLLVGGIVNAALVSMTPPARAAVQQCEMPAEVKFVEGLMASMPLNITVTEAGHPPSAQRPPRPAAKPQQRDDKIAQLIEGL